MERILNKPWLEKKAKYIDANITDCRSYRTIAPSHRHDILVERDSFFSIRREIGQKRLQSTKYWGVIHPVDLLVLISQFNIKIVCPNCMNGVYTNFWLDDNGPSWLNLAIASPNYTYGQEIVRLLDCGR